MAFFDTTGLDDDFIPESFDVDCPVCGKPIDIPLDRDNNIINCPHCDSEIEIESS